MTVPDGQLNEHETGSVQDGAELASLPADVDALSDELLNRYEEVTLLYDLSRELGVVLDVSRASRTSLARTLQVIPAQRAMVAAGDDVETSSRRRRQATTAPTVGILRSRTVPRMPAFGCTQQRSPASAAPVRPGSTPAGRHRSMSCTSPTRPRSAESRPLRSLRPTGRDRSSGWSAAWSR